VRVELGPIVSEFAYAVATGAGREIGCYGMRGEAKTQGALVGMTLHANQHFKTGHIIDEKGRKVLLKLPVPWMGVTDYHRSHKDKTAESLKKDFWEGAWTLSDDDHLAVLRGENASGDLCDLVKLNLFGLEDEASLDRVRRETCGFWAEEVAPTTSGHGVSLEAWLTGITSQRVPTHAKVAMFTSNLPEVKHWSWQRMRPGGGVVSRHPDHPERLTYRVPKGDNEYVSDEDRREWAEALSDRPDLAKRLLEGQPGSVQRGRAVAVKYVDQVPVGFNEEKHVSQTRLKPIKDCPIIIGQDGGLWPVTTIGQVARGEIRVYASFVMDAGMKQQYEFNVVPWIKQFAPWAYKNTDMIIGCYDSSMPDDESDSDRNPFDVIMEMLYGRDSVMGNWEKGPIEWASRETALFAILDKRRAGTSFEPALKIDPMDGEPLIAALRGAWFYDTDRFGNIMAEKPKKGNHPHEDCGDSFIYFACAAMPELMMSSKSRRGIKIETAFAPGAISDYTVDQDVKVESDFYPGERDDG